MGMDQATISLPYESFRTLQTSQDDLQKEIFDLKQKVATLESSTTAGDPELAKALLEGLLAARNVVAFAMGELPPETTKRWPADKLVVFARTIKKVASWDPSDPDLPRQANDFLEFAKHVGEIEAIRRERDLLQTIETETIHIPAI